MIAKGLCRCGCGGETKIVPQKCSNYLSGEHYRFIVGHNARGENHYNWNNGRRKHGCGYMRILMPGHNRALSDGYVYEHILIAEKALGKPLPVGAQVHHHNEQPSDNKTSGNLVVCQDDSYHKLLHQRMRAYKACGHANWRKCHYCHKYDSIDNMTLSRATIGSKITPYHKSCATKYQKERKSKDNRLKQERGIKEEPPQ